MEQPPFVNRAPQKHDDASCDESTDCDQKPPARAFAQGTGVLLQTVGMILFISSCCAWSLAGTWDPLLSRPQVLQHLQENQSIGVTVRTLAQQPAKAGVMLMVMFMTVGGLAMTGFGLGLQAEKIRSAWAALGTGILMWVILVIAGIGIWVGQASAIVRLYHALLTVVVLVLVGFTWVALKQVLAHPPPPATEVLGPDFKIPYSHYHDDPPDVRLARQLADRRARLEADQRALEKLEHELKNKHTDP